VQESVFLSKSPNRLFWPLQKTKKYPESEKTSAVYLGELAEAVTIGPSAVLFIFGPHFFALF